MDQEAYERALADPAAAFASPEAILESDLDPARKRELLQRWHREVESGGEPDLLTRFARAFAFLDTETGAKRPAGPQGLYGAVADLGRPTPDERRD
ncbi:MAG TPA: hypothetical protein VFG43_13110 [Geminicoccaceae bacterium]|nr:hypothetical protein [Geminicoccaceae bacterium]